MRNALRRFIRFVVRLVATVEIKGREHMPIKGGFVVATNHLGFLDAALAYYALDQWDIFVPVAEKWEESAVLRWLGKHLNFIFIDRFNPDLKAMREMIRRMEAGQTLIIAPEGTRARDEKMARGKPGVAFLASKSGFPVLPVAIAGTEDRIFLSNLKRLRRTNVTVSGGPVFNLPALPRESREESLQNYTDEIMCRI
ncbi:MAG: lysophospholipid acyltransferase family protein, partial [Anaerolineales bacterium]|nr:lysophospholipid acyltransferase family protein [Anaerolineales bacterium]